MLRRCLALVIGVVLALGLTPVAVQAADGPADLEITQTADPSPVATGSDLTWTISVVNHGPGDGLNVAVNGNFNEFGDTTDFVSLDIDRGSCTHTEATYYCTIGTVPTGATVTLTLVVTVLSTSSVVNVADVQAANDSDYGNNHVSEAIPAGRAADLSVTKTADTGTAQPGDVVSYEIVAANDGPATATDVLLTDTLPSGLIDVEVAPVDSCSVIGADVECDAGDLTSDSSFTATVTATVDPAFTGDEIVNSAVVSSITPDSDHDDNAAIATVAVESPSADLAVMKTITSGPLIAGEPVRYRITVDNDGPSEAEDAVLTDVVPSAVGELAASTDRGSCTVTGQSIACAFGSLVSGARASVLVQGVLSAAATGTLTNTAEVTAATPDPDSSDDSATVSAAIGVSADLAIAKTASTASAGSGDTVRYTLTVVNNGPSDATGVAVADPLSADLVYVSGSCTATQGTCGASGDGISFTVGDLAVGASAQLTYDVDVAADAPDEQIENTATVVYDGADPNPDDNEARYTLNVEGAADVALTKTASSASVTAGGALTYTITARNDGPGAAENLVLGDLVPASFAVDSATPSAGSCDLGTAGVRCELAALASGAEWVVTVVGSVAPDTPPGTLRNIATVSSDADPTLSNNLATALVRVQARADLTVTKSAPSTVVAGERLEYSIEVVNDGPSTAVATTVVDTLPAGTVFVSGGGDGASCAPHPGAPRMIVCVLGDLTPGDDPRTLGIVVEVGPAVPDGTELRNVVQAVSDVPGLSDGLIGQAVTVVQASADLEVFKTVRPDVLFAGAEGSFGIRVLNRGPSAATDLVLTDVVPAGLVVESALAGGGECAVSGSTVSCSRPSLAAGASWRVVVEVTVSSEARGSVSNTATASAGTTDPDLTDNAATVVAQIQAAADVGMVKTALRPEVQPGGTALFFLTAVNLGPSTAADVAVVDELPSGLVPTAVSSGACTISVQTVACAFGDLAPFAARSTLVVAAVAEGAPEGRLVNTAAATATADRDATNDADDAAVVVAPPGAVESVADLSVAKTADADEAAPGDLVDFVITVANAGPDVAEQVSVVDALPAGLTLVSVSAAAPFSCTTDGPVVCSAGALGPGSAEIAVRARVDAEVTASELVNAAAVSAATADPDPTDNTARAAVAVASGEDGDGDGDGGELPVTGSSVPWWAIAIGGALLAAGILALVAAARRRRPPE